ncbi:hypothetical protein Trydic_g20682 [Trypoxylus dichotomus]
MVRRRHFEISNLKSDKCEFRHAITQGENVTALILMGGHAGRRALKRKYVSFENVRTGLFRGLNLRRIQKREERGSNRNSITISRSVSFRE